MEYIGGLIEFELQKCSSHVCHGPMALLSASICGWFGVEGPDMMTGIDEVAMARILLGSRLGCSVGNIGKEILSLQC